MEWISDGMDHGPFNPTKKEVVWLGRRNEMFHSLSQGWAEGMERFILSTFKSFHSATLFYSFFAEKGGRSQFHSLGLKQKPSFSFTLSIQTLAILSHIRLR